MEAVRGQLLEVHPLGSLEKRADLVYYDGPVLALSEGPSGDPYLHLWCDVDDNTNRWLVFRVTREQLTRFVNRLVPLRQLVVSPPDGFLYLADVRNDLSYAAVQLVLPTALPDSYVPPADSNYQFDPVNTELDLGQLAKRYGTPLLNLHLRRGRGISFGSADIVTLGSLLETTGKLAEHIAVNLFTKRRGTEHLTADEAKVYGAFEYVTSKAASFSAIIRPVIQQANLPGFEDRTAQVVSVIMELLETTREFEGLKVAAGKYSDSVLRGLEHLLTQVEETAAQLDVEWVEPETNRASASFVDAHASRRILDNMNRLESEEAEGLWLEGTFTALDLKLRSYRFVASTGRESTGRFDSKIAYPLTHLSFEEKYRVYMTRKTQKLGGRKRLRIDEVIGQIQPLSQTPTQLL
jgi:hypothetical protein